MRYGRPIAALKPRSGPLVGASATLSNAFAIDRLRKTVAVVVPAANNRVSPSRVPPIQPNQ